MVCLPTWILDPSLQDREERNLGCLGPKPGILCHGDARTLTQPPLQKC